MRYRYQTNLTLVNLPLLVGLWLKTLIYRNRWAWLVVCFGCGAQARNNPLACVLIANIGLSTMAVVLAQNQPLIFLANDYFCNDFIQIIINYYGNS
jgi:hypothetical protein